MASKKGGRPSSYRPEYAKQAFKLCLLGATDADLAVFFDVAESTINNWKDAHPEFLESLKGGKEQADARVAESLFHRALGYEHEAVKITTHAETGHTTITPYIERYPPDTTAAIFWLKNRRPDLWRDQRAHELTGKDGGPIETRDATFDDLSAEELAKLAARLADGDGDEG